ncbi:MAG: hypothetical protein MJ238_05430 [Bacilli bacterium]|nr:hypothetical protein [Bacilli bacterium]
MDDTITLLVLVVLILSLQNKSGTVAIIPLYRVGMITIYITFPNKAP